MGKNKKISCIILFFLALIFSFIPVVSFALDKETEKVFILNENAKKSLGLKEASKVYCYLKNGGIGWNGTGFVLEDANKAGADKNVGIVISLDGPVCRVSNVLIKANGYTNISLAMFSLNQMLIAKQDLDELKKRIITGGSGADIQSPFDRIAAGSIINDMLYIENTSVSAVKKTDALRIVNRNQPVSKARANDTSALVAFKNKWFQSKSRTQYLEAQTLKQLDAMLKASGVTKITLLDTYRNFARQSELFNASVKKFKSRGMGKKEAYEYTAGRTAIPGSSEHHMGYTADVVQRGGQMVESFDKTTLGKWMAKNCKNYGFILRYAKNKTKMTGIMYEPWHFRYVGKPLANYLYNGAYCMEEFASKLKKEDAVYYTYGNDVYIHIFLGKDTKIRTSSDTEKRIAFSALDNESAVLTVIAAK